MKKIIYITILLISIYSFAQQQIFPLRTSPSDIPPNSYIKDMNNEYDKYVGLWKGNWNGKTVYLDLKKVRVFRSGSDSYYIDKILGERKIVSVTGIVEIDRISNFDYEHPEFTGPGYIAKYNGKICQSLTFYPKNMCNKTARLIIADIQDVLSGPINNTVTTTQMTLHFEYLPSAYDENCIHNAYVELHNDFPMNFPKDIVLTKQ